MKQKLYTTSEISKFCQVTHRTALNWVTAGKIHAHRTPGGHSRVTHEDLLAFLNQYKMPISAELTVSATNIKRVLIVEDDRAIVKLIETVLSKTGQFETKSAYNGFKAGLLFKEFNPDLVTLDLMMPGLDGFDVCQLIRSVTSTEVTKILVISDVHDPILEKEILKQGANIFLHKPVSGEILLKHVNRLLNVGVLTS